MAKTANDRSAFALLGKSTMRAMLSPEETIALLRQAYGELPRRPRRDPVDELVLGVLSQNTSDVNSARAFERLKAAFPSWPDLVDADVSEVEEAIRPGGLGPTKAVRLKALVQELWARRGSFDLRFLSGLPLDEAKEWLRSLPGVGPKTAAVMLLFSLDLPAMPVDTHVHRVARCLGYVEANVSPEQTQQVLESIVQPEDVYAFHIYLIVHGRRTCIARRPRCPICVLRHGCPSASLFYPDLDRLST